ncbi:hypothetical protein F4604DRAFT_1942832 [Suillus subluteus]|nr:hypothetical protein F4604DRAFT_1942832 [Suillus subluteus]
MDRKEAVTRALKVKPPNAQAHEGDLAAWFRDLVRVNKEATSKTYCWRTLDGQVLCDGSPNFVTLYLGIPNIPKHIRPLTKEAEEQHSLIYDVVGLVFCDPTPKLAHFVARYSPDGKRVYHYDDLSHGGYAQLMKNATLRSHLVGNLHDIPAPVGFNVHGVVYRLRGGSDAQNFFAEYQMAAAERLHHVHVECDLQSPSSIPTISLSRPGISSVHPDNLIWLKNPATTQNIEYEQVVTSNTGSNSKKPPQGSRKKTKKLRILLPVEEIEDQPSRNEEEKPSN